MTEHEVYCPAKHKMLTMKGTLTKENPMHTIQVLLVRSCPEQGSCPSKGASDCVVGHELQGRWDKP